MVNFWVQKRWKPAYLSILKGGNSLFVRNKTLFLTLLPLKVTGECAGGRVGANEPTKPQKQSLEVQKKKTRRQEEKQGRERKPKQTNYYYTTTTHLTKATDIKRGGF